ncbi:hypothetical protein BRC82_03760 [Halobacteriales archaeon QS_1_67_19]|nr:MAG: hypothetical protein BRC82_03760 [Halobacteriales archaeon QS_1_67_19]
MTVGELADALVETGVSDARKRAFVSLVHTHLPKLTDCGVIDYEHPEEAVSIEDEGVWQLEPLLSVAERHEIGHGIRSVFDGSSADTVAEPD